MTTTLTSSVNLLTELDEDSSQSYVRRVVARILGHADLSLAEAKYVWETAGFSEELWDRYVPTVRSA